tara:strand:- start:89 stop:454 length:366 start_codon:yes stop_codon:yes gene_type:complete
MIKRPIKYHFKKGKVKYDPDQYEDGTGWGPSGMYPRKKIFHLKTRQKLSENQIQSRMQRNFYRKRGSDELAGEFTANVQELSFGKGTRTLKGKKAKKFYTRAKDINRRGKDLAVSKFESEF